MALVPGLASASDLHAKLQRDAAIMVEEVSCDAFFNFVVTGYSLIDWTMNDPAIPNQAKTDPEVCALYADKWLKVCGDLATAAKHFALSKRKAITTSAMSQQGYGKGRYGKGPYGVGEESISVLLNDGTEFSALELVAGVRDTWHSFFSRHGI
jgi:hypothetical protein